MFSARFLVFLTSAVILVKAEEDSEKKILAKVRCLCQYKRDEFEGLRADTSCLATVKIAQQTKSCESSSTKECPAQRILACNPLYAISVSNEPIKLVSGTTIYEVPCQKPGSICRLFKKGYCKQQYNKVSLYGVSLNTGKCGYYTFLQCCGCRCSSTLVGLPISVE
ncbi:Uncharacterised protein g11067 [Pycnogonum litorale]